MLCRNYGKITLIVIALLLDSASAAFPQRTGGAAPKPPRKAFDLQIEVAGANPAEKVEGARVVVVSEEEGVRFTKEKRTTKQGIASFAKVPQGKIKIQVIARECETFGDVFNLTQDDQTIRITVKKRNPPSGGTGGAQ